MSPGQYKFQMAILDFLTVRQHASIQKIWRASVVTKPSYLGSVQMQVFAGVISPLSVGLRPPPTPQVSSLIL